MPLRPFRNVLLIILLIGGNAYAQMQLPKCILFGFGNCIGTLRFSNGDIYTGEFNYGKPNVKWTPNLRQQFKWDTVQRNG